MEKQCGRCSKAFIAVAVTALIVGGGVYGIMKRSENRMQAKINALQARQEELGGRYGNLEALDTAVIEGYYARAQRNMFGKTTECDSFVITGGSEKFIKELNDLYDAGNRLYERNYLDQPVIRLNGQLVWKAESQAIMESTVDDPVEMTVLVDNDNPGHGAFVCDSDIYVLRIRK